MNHDLNHRVSELLGTQRVGLVALLLEALGPLCAEIDPNWHVLRITIERSPTADNDHQSCNRHDEIIGLYENAPAFSARPIRVWVNAPSCGDRELDLERVSEALSPLLMVYLVLTKYHCGFLWTCRTIEAWNPDHKIQIIPGVTSFGFENGTTGIVFAGDAQEFLVMEGLSLPKEVWGVRRYSAERLRDELAPVDDDALERFSGEVVKYEYLPCRFDVKGEPLNSPRMPVDPEGEVSRALVARVSGEEGDVRFDG